MSFKYVDDLLTILFVVKALYRAHSDFTESVDEENVYQKATRAWNEICET